MRCNGCGIEQAKRLGRRGPMSRYCSPQCRARSITKTGIIKGETFCCLRCGKTSASNGGGFAKFCSKNCRETAYADSRRKTSVRVGDSVACCECGMQFLCRSATAKVCSQGCKLAYKRRVRDEKRDFKHTCKRCGKVTMKTKQDARRSIYCSKRCCAHAASEIRHPNGLKPPAVDVDAVCVTCGARFTKKGGRKTCSIRCAKSRKLEQSNDNSKARHRAEFVARHGSETIHKECFECGNIFKFSVGVRRTKFCSSECSSRSFKRNAKHKRRTIYNTGDTISMAVVYKAHKGKCVACGYDVNRKGSTHNPMSATLDHLTPLAKGGTHSMDNIILMCRDCNTDKSDMLPLEWAWIKAGDRLGGTPSSLDRQRKAAASSRAKNRKIQCFRGTNGR